MLQTLLAMLVTLVLFAAPAGAQTPREAQIRETISAQVEAFRRDDAAAAYAIAAPEIQAMFRDSAAFLDMVRRGYPEVYRPQTFRFLGLDQSDGRILQRVLVQGPDGSLVTAIYEMIELDGRWRIAGCSLLKGSDA